MSRAKNHQITRPMMKNALQFAYEAKEENVQVPKVDLIKTLEHMLWLMDNQRETLSLNPFDPAAGGTKLYR